MARKDPAAVKLGRKGGKRSMSTRTPQELTVMRRAGGIASMAARWKDHEYSTNPAAVKARERRRRLKLEQDKETA